MTDIGDLLSMLGGIQFVVAFLALPFLYLRDSEEVAKEVRQWASASAPVAAPKDLDAALALFRMEWWLILAVTLGLAGVCLLRYGPDVSGRLQPLERGIARAILDFYGVAVTTGALLHVRYRRTQLHWRMLSATMQTAGAAAVSAGTGAVSSVSKEE